MTLKTIKSNNVSLQLVHESPRGIKQGATVVRETTSGIADGAVMTSIDSEASQRQKLAQILDEAIAITDMISYDTQGRHGLKAYHQSN
jgi:hypothetical protein